MIIDGRAIAADIHQRIIEEIASREQAPRLAIIACAPNFATQRYLALKKEKALALGISISIVELPAGVATEEVVRAVSKAVEQSEGVIVQLPLPKEIDSEAVVSAIPPSHDVDALNPATTEVLSPVVAACKEIIERYTFSVENKRAVVVGQGKLVGVPSARWLKTEGAMVTVVQRETEDVIEIFKQAEVIVTGAGDPGFLKPEMVSEGVVVLDAGTSEEGGELRGDADPAVARKAALFTPVPGGIGPVTIACLFQNLLALSSK